MQVLNAKIRSDFPARGLKGEWYRVSFCSFAFLLRQERSEAPNRRFLI